MVVESALGAHLVLNSVYRRLCDSWTRILFAGLFASAALMAQNPVFVNLAPVSVPGGPSSLVLGDFNGDGVTDIATADSSSGMVSILPGSGGGFFLPPRNFAAGAGAHYIVAADFNRDGRLDLAVAN